MRRVAKLEIELGLGLDVSREWVEKQKPHGKNMSYANICEPICLACGNRFKGSHHIGGKKFCPACGPKVRLRAVA